MRHMKIAVLAVLLSTIWSCTNETGDSINDNTSGMNNLDSPQAGRIAGKLAVLATEERLTFDETEPNDTTIQAELLAEVAAGTRIEIFGNLSEIDDPTDSFRFSTAEALVVTLVFSFDFDPENIDYALAFSDFENFECTLGSGGESFSFCQNSDKNPETTTQTVSGEFAITIQSIMGAGDYALGLAFTSPDPDVAMNPRATTASVTTDFFPSQMLVKFDQHLSEADCNKIIAAQGLELVKRAPSGVHLLRPSAKDDPALSSRAQTLRTINQITRIGGVRYAEPNRIYAPAHEPDDEYFDIQWHYDLINLPEAWDLSVGTEDVIIAVVDTGVLLQHPEFANRLMDGFDFILDPQSARDGDSIDDDPTDAGDLSGGPGQSSFHGTHVAGTLGAATNNSSGVSGVTWNCRIMPLRALGVGGGTSFDIAEAVFYAAGLPNSSGRTPDRRADVINLSIAGSAGAEPSLTMGAAINAAAARGVVVVAAAGNQSSSEPAYPAAFDEVISVSACDPQFNLAPYSNFGETIEISAPGGNLAFDLTGDGLGDGVLSLSAIQSGGTLDFTYSFQHGTSMATPHVSGVAALMRSVNPALTAGEIREILAETALDVGTPGFDLQFGAGVVDAALAVNEAAARAGVEAPTQPRLSLSSKSIDFGSNLDELAIQITNTGSGFLEIEDFSVVEVNGFDWLMIDPIASSGSANFSSVQVRVERSGLVSGSYFGKITLRVKDQDDQTIDVAMSVGQPSVVDETIFVVAIDAQTRESIAQATTTLSDDFVYEISGFNGTPLPAGVYKIYAGTDRDEDGLICDLGELCGGYPTAIVANDIEVLPGQTQGDINFAVGELLFQTNSLSKGRRPPDVKLLD